MNRRGWGIALFILVLAAYALAGWRAVLAHTDPVEMDTVAYLDAALQIRQTGGILNHLPNLFRGVYTEATQHPLYLLVLSPFAENTTRFFIAAKIMSYTLGFAFLAVFLAAARRLFGTGIAGGAGWLWVMSAGFLTLMTTVACEGLLGIFVVAFWFALAVGRDDRRWWAAAGLFAGLAYLTKSIGILTLPVFAASALWWERKNLKRLAMSRAFWAFFGVFVLTASPLFIRNVVVYGTPLYSDSTGVMWVDKWEEFSYERAAEGRFTPAKYLSAHSPAQILQIFVDGLVRRDPKMIADGLKPLPFWRSLDPDFFSGFHHRVVAWQEPWAAALIFLAGAGWWKNRRHAAAVPTLALWGLFIVFVGWYSKIFSTTPPTRLLYPALIFVPIYAALGLKALLPSGLGRKAAVAALSLTIAGLVAHGEWIRSDVRASFKFPVIFKIQKAWVDAVARPGDRVLVSQMFGSYLFYFKGQMRAECLGWPKLDGMDDLVKWVKEKNVRFAFIDNATVLYNRPVFREHYRVEKTGTLLSLRPLPAVFKPIPKDPRIPPVYDVYAVQ